MQQLSKVGLSICEKQGFELIELEEAITRNQGCWLILSKCPAIEAPAEEKAGGKKAAAKKGQANAEDLKPIFGKAWLDLSDLNQPGATKTSKRVYIETIAPAVKETREEGGDVWVDQEEFEPVFEPSKTYVHLEIELNKPVVPEKSDL